jgi:hypothetical protein
MAVFTKITPNQLYLQISTNSPVFLMTDALCFDLEFTDILWQSSNVSEQH